MAVSGAAGLGWQMLWTTQLAAGLGHEIAAVLGVLAAFFAGTALGAWRLGRAIARSAHPGRWYAGLELGLALWGGVLVWLLPTVAPLAGAWLGPAPAPLAHWALAFGVPLALLLPATAAMGATWPAMVRQWDHARRALGGLYAANTAGAVAGVLLVVFVAIPGLGLRQTGLLLVLANLLCAVTAGGFWWRPAAAAKAPDPVPSAPVRSPRRLALLLAATGFLGLGYEVLAVRVLSQVTENTVYSYALLLAVYLLGTAIGAAVDPENRQAPPSAETPALDRWFGALALALLLGGTSLWWADALWAWPTWLWGPGAVTALAGEALAATAAMAWPTLVMGALFTRLCRLAQQQGWPLGRALACNTAGAALAPAVVGVVLLPGLGARWGLCLLALGYLACVRPAAWRAPTAWAPALATAALALGGPPLRLVDLPPGAELLSYREGVSAAVSVVRDDAGVARLRINNRAQEGSTAGGLVEVRLAQLPLLLHPQPAQVLMLGLGTGYTAQAAAVDSQTRVTAVELLPEVIAASALFTGGAQRLPAATPVQVVAADARRHVLADPRRYDVVVADLFHPARSGAGALYTVEQFQAVRQRLAPGGLFCQWLALHQMDLPTLRSIVAAFVQVYPQAVMVLASNSLDTPVLGLLARPDQPLLQPTAVQARLDAASAPLRRALALAQLPDVYAVLGSVLAGPDDLARLAAGAPVNSDDLPVVTHRAPWDTYAPEASPRQRLAALLDLVSPGAGPWPDPGLPADARGDRLRAYETARAAYLRLGLAVQPAPDAAVMLARLQAPLLAVLATSPDFRPAFEPLWALAQAVQAQDPERAQAVREALQSVAARRAPNLH